MKTKTINIYKFEELSEAAKVTAINWFREGLFDWNWYESTYDDAKNIGLNITSFDTDRNDIEGKLTQSGREVANAILKEHGNKCDTYQTASDYLKALDAIVEPDSDSDEFSDYEDTLEEMEKDFEHALLEDYLSMLRKEIEYMESEENVIENIIANEYEFTEDGRIA